MTSFTATITRRGAPGVVEAEHEINGTDELVARALRTVAETLTPGDRAEVIIVRNLPPDHLLVGVDRGATAPKPPVSAPTCAAGKLRAAARTVDGTHTIAHGHIDLERMRREQLRDARFAHAGAYLYAGRVLTELGAAACVAERELRLTEALQHIQQHCHTAYAAITTVDRD